MTLEDAIRAAFASGRDEITVRVSRYAADGRTPEAFQALVKHQNRTVTWGCGVRGEPVSALRAALDDALRPAAPPEDLVG